MAMATEARRWTVEMLRQLPDDGNRHEIIDGELLVSAAPSWDHGAVVADLHLLIGPYVLQHHIGYTRIAPQEVELGDATLVEPDLFVVPLVNGRRPRTWEETRTLLLAVEVLSPSSAHWDRVVKRALYQSQGVAEYWIVDIDARVVERWRPGESRPEILTDRLEWQPDPARPPLVIDLEGFFASALGS
jgi:Uma2 family endonuclease